MAHRAPGGALTPRRRRTPRLLVRVGIAAALLLGALAVVRVFVLWQRGIIGVYDGDWIEVAADPARGWHWPFRMYVPRTQGPLRLLVGSNGGPVAADFAVHHRRAERDLKGTRRLADELGVAVLLPSFPRFPSRGVYTHALDRDTVLAPPPIGALDRQLLAMVRAGTDELRRRGRAVCARVMLHGFSASGMFASRFALLHPEVVEAVAVGAPGGWPMVPAAADRGVALPYPIGTADYEALTGRRFPAGEARRIRSFFFLGADDDNDSVPYRESYDKEHARLVNERFGSTPRERWDDAGRLYAGFPAQFRLYPGVGHDIPAAVLADVKTFLRAHDDRSACGATAR